jgi:3-dehydroquinate synthase
MTCASMLSEDLLGFKDHDALRSLLQQYGLPTFLRFDADKVFSVLKMDKKRAGKDMNFILLERIGKGVVHPIPLAELERKVRQIAIG